MNGIRQNAIRLFRFNGIDVSLHWSWFLVAAYEIGDRQTAYSSITWNVAEYLALFLIVMLHEFGHALACRQVGGVANQIVLWPLGGVAYVNPPQRPGAYLWSIAAGPLVNVALLPILKIVGILFRSQGLAQELPNAFLLLQAVAWINLRLLIFNILPIYPLDGGQILRSLLWFVMGRARSLMAATVIGFLAANAIRLVWSSVRLYRDELLEGTATSASIASPCKIAASRRILLPLLQDIAAFGRVLALPELPEIIRHVPIAGRMPALLDPIHNDRLSGLWTNVSDATVDRRNLASLYRAQQRAVLPTESRKVVRRKV